MQSRFWLWGLWSRLALLVLCLPAKRLLAADVDVCAVCGGPFVDVYYSIEDKVTLEKRHVCKNCEQSYPECFVCGLPANTNAIGFIQLPDQRVLCTRDAKTAVLTEEEGLRICYETRDGLDRLFSRFTYFPETNVTVRLVDRVHLVDLFKLAGNDYHCPNVWGITEARTNHNRVQYDISLMTGLPLDWFQATCAHEYGHTWVNEHLLQARKETLHRDAEEGFCELLSFLFMDSRNDEPQKALILRNAYTRGQIDLFVAAQRTYGFEEILDWMQFGTDDRLSASDPGRVRKVDQQRLTTAALPTFIRPSTANQATPETLKLKAIFWDPKRPTVLINDHTFSPDEEATLRLGPSNVLVRCLSISADSVQLTVGGPEHQQTLRLK